MSFDHLELEVHIFTYTQNTEKGWGGEGGGVDRWGTGGGEGRGK